MKTTWRRFKPRLRGSLKDPIMYTPDSLYAQARLIANNALHASRNRLSRDDGYKHSNRAVKLLRERDTQDATHLLALLILQSPVAARAQHEMDTRRGGYKNHQARLFELIDFNDTFVSTVLALPESELSGFNQTLRSELTAFSRQLGVINFTDKQLEAITHGLSREIAVYRGAKRLGYLARMASRVQDARGVDMIITDPETKKSLGIDVKTRSSFHFRLLNLQRQRRIDEDKRLACELAGFCTISYGDQHQRSDTVLFRIATRELGPIVNYSFEDLGPLSQQLADAFEHHAKYIV